MTVKMILCGAAALAALAAGPAQAVRGDVLLRLRGIMVAPSEKSGSILPAFPGEKVKVHNSAMPEVDVTYMATDHIGLELVAGTTKHSASGLTGTTGSDREARLYLGAAADADGAISSTARRKDPRVCRRRDQLYVFL